MHQLRMFEATIMYAS